MKPIKLYCGVWANIPVDIQNRLYVMSNPFKTEKETIENGKFMFTNGGEFFSNNSNELYGLRLAIQESNIDSNDVGKMFDYPREQIEIIFYGEDGMVSIITANSGGRLSQHPIGFFDGGIFACSKLIRNAVKFRKQIDYTE